MANVNISKVHLLNVPLENDYKHTINFTDSSSQATYFLSRKQYSFDQLTYQRKDFKVRVPQHIDKINSCNYVMYQNSFYTNKWFYAFITKKTYISDGVTEIEIETDVMQTWMFDFTVKPSFVEREHVSDDGIGKHTLPEGLETGPYTSCKAPTKINHYESGTYICIAVSELFDEFELSESETKKEYNGVYSGLYYLACITNQNATDILRIYDKKGKADAIYSVFLLPKEFVYNTDEPISFRMGQSEGINYTFGFITSSKNVCNVLRNESLQEIEYKEVPINTKLADGYTPRNKKLFTGEFNYMILSNNVGSDIALHYEDFKNNKPRFKVIGAITPGCSVKCIPIGYKTADESTNIDDSYNYGIVGGKFPICSWNSDSYTNWLTQNGVNIGLGIGGSVLTAVGGVGLMMTGAGALAGAGAVASGVMGIAGSLGQVHQQSLVPDQAKGNANSGDVTYSSKNLVFTAYQVSVKKEYAEIIDNYFDMFGYKVNRVKVPNKNHRSKWWFTKTIDVNIDGAIPNEDMQKIKDCYNKGITFWRNGSEIQNYSLSNNIV